MSSRNFGRITLARIMKIKVDDINFTAPDGLAVVSVSYWDGEKTPHNSAVARVFVSATGSVDEIKAAALNAAKDFLRTCAEAKASD